MCLGGEGGGEVHAGVCRAEGVCVCVRGDVCEREYM